LRGGVERRAVERGDALDRLFLIRAAAEGEPGAARRRFLAGAKGLFMGANTGDMGRRDEPSGCS
jgi:hypothetical protein